MPNLIFRCASRTFCIISCLALVLACWARAAEPGAASASPADVGVVKEVLAVAAGGAADAGALHTSLEAAVGKVGDVQLRQQLQTLMPDLQAAGARHARIQQIEADVKALKGTTQTAPGGPAWLRTVAGDTAMQLFDRLISVDLNDRISPHEKTYKLNENVKDDWLARLDGLTDLENLDIANLDIKGPGLKYVGTLTNLTQLNLTLTPVTDEYLEPLAGLTKMKRLGLASAACNGTGCRFLTKMTSLENLNFHHTPVNDDGLKEICKLTSLERLEVVHTFFTDEGAANFAKLVNVQRLQIGSRKATGASVSFLRALPKLHELDLHDLDNPSEAIRYAGEIPTLTVFRVYLNPVKDDDVKMISHMANLEELVLGGAQATDAGIESLENLKKLKKLTLGGTKVSPAAMDKLKAALPGLVVLP